jgi:MoaA/NifB/PqqE/SkfB family radical SAM enzyme
MEFSQLIRGASAAGDRAHRVARIAPALAKVGLMGARIPLFASIELTRGCDGWCRYCGTHSRHGPDLPLDHWLGVIDDLAASGTMRISFTGGEPLLYGGIAELVARCAARGIEVEINTNGRLLPEKLPSLPALRTVVLSLDGIREVNDAVRGKGAYEASVAAYRAARAAGVRCGFLAVLSTECISGLEEFLELMRLERFPVLFQPVFEWYLRSRRKVRRLPPRDAFRRAIDRLLEARRSGYPVLNSAAGLSYLRNWPGPAPISCGGGRYFVRITSTGVIERCGLRGDKTPGGIDARNGILAGMAKMDDFPCASCWCASRAELNLALSFEPRAVAFVLRRLLLDTRSH